MHGLGCPRPAEGTPSAWRSSRVTLTEDQLKRQLKVCQKVGAMPQPVLADQKAGIARNVRDGVLPIHGMWVAPERGTTGWYIWAGEYSDDPDFFVPLHVAHLVEWCPLALPYLALPPGWRFLTDGSYEDVWEDDQMDLTPMPDEA